MNKKRNKQQQTIQKQLDYLYKEDYLIKEKGKNKQLYSINWEKIGVEFYETTKKFIKIKNIRESFDKQHNYKKLCEETFKNKEFKNLLVKSFNIFSKTKFNLEDLFLGYVTSFGSYDKEEQLEVNELIEKTKIKKDFIDAMKSLSFLMIIQDSKEYVRVSINDYLGKFKK